MKSFLNSSQLNLHKHFYHHDWLYRCFSSKCNRAYKWPQDLLCHIKVHLPTVHRCTKCDYSTKVKHLNVHTDDLPFQCRGCPTRYKHAKQHYRHEKATGHYWTFFILYHYVPSICAVSFVHCFIIVEVQQHCRHIV